MIPVIVIIRFQEELEIEEERYEGFLVDEKHAMYHIPGFGIMLSAVEPTDEPAVYVEQAQFTRLGKITESDNAELIINTLADRLKNMTAFEFLTKVLLHIREEFDYEGLVINLGRALK